MHRPLSIAASLRTGRPLLAALLCLGWAQSALATCGDYVVLGPNANPAAGYHDGMPSHSAWDQAGLIAPGLVTQSLPQRFPLPCNGPHCQRGSLPASTPPAPLPTPVNQWGCIAGQAAELELPGRPWQPAEILAHPVDEATTIFHPPRPRG